MRLSHKYKFVFISVPKTASSTARRVLNPFSDIIGVDDPKSPYKNHTTAPKLRTHFNKNGWIWTDYFKFAFVRNPWNKCVSEYFYKKKYAEKFNANHIIENMNIKFAKVCDKIIKSNLSFEDYIKLDPCPLNYGRAQSEWTHDKNGNKIVDFIGKFENLQEDFDFVCDKIGIPTKKLPYINKSKHKHYTEYYNNETRELVAKRYARDIEGFGYEFDNGKS